MGNRALGGAGRVKIRREYNINVHVHSSIMRVIWQS